MSPERRCSTPYHSSALPVELLIAIFAHFSDVSWPDTRTLRAASLVSQHWHTHGANAALYANVLLFSRRACHLLDRTISCRPSLGSMIISFSMIPWVVRPMYCGELESTSTRATGINDRVRDLPDDDISTRCVLRIISTACNLRTLAVRAVQGPDQQRISFKDLATNIVSRQLRTLSLSGDVPAQRSSSISRASLLGLLRSPPFAHLNELRLRKYWIPAGNADWRNDEEGLPAIKCLWISSCIWEALPDNPNARPSMLPSLFGRTLQSVYTTRTFQSIEHSAQMWSSEDWPRLMSLSISELFPLSTFPLSTFRTPEVATLSRLRHLELPGNIFNTHYGAISFPPRICTLVLLVSHTPALAFFASFAPWLHLHANQSFPATLRKLRFRLDCRRIWAAVQMWKVLILALALRETSLTVTGDIMIWVPDADMPFYDLQSSSDVEPAQPAASDALSARRRTSRSFSLWSKLRRLRRST